MLTSDLISLFGSRTELAEALGISASAISQWGRFIPNNRRIQIQKAIRNLNKTSHKLNN